MAFLATVPPFGPFNFPLTVVVGDTLEFGFQVTGMDVRDYTFRWTARKVPGGTALWNITAAEIAWDGDDSQVTMVVPKTTTDDLPTGIDAIGFVWDLAWTEPTGERRTLLRGPVNVVPSVA